MRDQMTTLYYDPALAALNDAEINWGKQFPCQKCRNHGSWPPSGSYASTLLHFEQLLGELPDPRLSLRLLVLFQDPKPPGKDPENVSQPLKPPENLAEDEHRYFCLTPVAWKFLCLDHKVSRELCWPTEETAHHYLHRYYRKRKGFLDGVIAYFLYLLRPSQAYVTNLAKCHLGRRPQASAIFGNCATKHLKRRSKFSSRMRYYRLLPSSRTLTISLSSVTPMIRRRCVRLSGVRHLSCARFIRRHGANILPARSINCLRIALTPTGVP